MTRRVFLILLFADIAAVRLALTFAANYRTVIRVVDGDTIVLDGKERVR